MRLLFALPAVFALATLGCAAGAARPSVLVVERPDLVVVREAPGVGYHGGHASACACRTPARPRAAERPGRRIQVVAPSRPATTPHQRRVRPEAPPPRARPERPKLEKRSQRRRDSKPGRRQRGERERAQRKQRRSL